MATPSQSQPKLAFGPFEMDTVTGELSKRGIPIRLGRQPCQILLALVRKPGELVAREQLREELWSKDTFVDFEHSLNAAINKLRQALGDSAENPRYIETLPGRGYRFVASVQHVLPPAKSPPAKLKVEAPAAPIVPVWRRWYVVTALAMGALGIAYWLGAARKTDANPRPVVRFSITAPPGFALEPGGTRQAFAVSPDGSRLAFTAVDSQGVYRIFMRDLASLESRVLPNSEGVHHIEWSPDGVSLLSNIRGKLRRSGPQEGSYQVICDMPRGSRIGTLLPSGEILLGNRLFTYLVPATGGEPKRLDRTYAWPQVLPDREHLIYLEFDASKRSVARVARWNSPETARDILETKSRVVYVPSLERPSGGYLLYVRAGNLLAQPFDAKSLRLNGEPRALAHSIFTFYDNGSADFSVSASGVLVYAPFVPRSQISWIERSGRSAGTVGAANIALKYVRLSPDQKKIAADIYDVEKGHTEIWVFDVASGASRRLVISPGHNTNTVWSPDSRRIVYLRGHAVAPPRLFMRGIGENDPEEPLAHADFQIPSDWSPDGRYVAYSNTAFPASEAEPHGDVWLIDLERNRKVTAILNTPATESLAMFSPDGRKLAFIANDSGRPEVYVQSFEPGEPPRLTGERQQISRGGALYLRWERDSRSIAYLGSDNRVYSVRVSPRGEPAALFTIPLEARAVLPFNFGFDVSNDGRFLAPGLSNREPPPLVVVQNWESMLRRSF